jgi:hypothetical protein
MNIRVQLLFLGVLLGFVVKCSANTSIEHPRIYATNEDRSAIIKRIETEKWAKQSWLNLLESVDPYVTRHQTDPEWIVSRLAMYWKDGAHYTQCYIKNQNWDYGEGNAPVPTVRLPGMRTWNQYVNVPLEDRIPYNETGDMWGLSRSTNDSVPVLVPYKESGHMIRANNAEILHLAEQAAFAYYITQEDKYAKFSSDILWTWLLGVYYMNPPLNPDKSTGGPGGYAPGGIMGYYDYEVIHDDLQQPAATTYDFIHDYMSEHPDKHVEITGKNETELAGVVFKRFIEIGLIRGGSRGNWNVNRYNNLINSMLVLEPDSYYADGKGRDYYIPFYTEKTTDYHAALPDFMKNFDPVTGLWPESPGYASGIIPTVMEMGIKLYKSGVNRFDGNVIVQKAALANLGWLDARGNLVVFGDMRGGSTNYSVFENLLTYYSWTGNTAGAQEMATVIKKGILAGQYNRDNVGLDGICFFQPLPESDNELPYHRAAYSIFHRHIIMKNGNDENNSLMFTLYGGSDGSHLTSNGLAVQFYAKGYVLAPDASAYESYWSADAGYHRGILGANTIVPGYALGEITINAMDPAVDDTKDFYNTTVTSESCSFADISAMEKRRLVAMVRTSSTSGYYVDIFRSNQSDNDYIYHNLGDTAIFRNVDGEALALSCIDEISNPQHKDYSFFKNPRKVEYDNDFLATWKINKVSPALNTDLWMMGQDNREILLVDAPPTTLSDDLTPGQVNKSPQTTPTMVLRQIDNNAQAHPFVSVFEAYNEGEKNIQNISKLSLSDHFVSIAVTSKSGGKQYICNAIDGEVYKPVSGMRFQGIFGIASENQDGFEYLYLGRGKMLKKDHYCIEAVDGVVSAELKLVDGHYYYSSDKPIKITLKSGKAKEYKAGYNLLID